MNTKLRVFEAFAGYGSQHIALDLLQRDFPDFTFEVVGIAEFDDKVSRLYNAAHNSQLPNFGDVTKINWGGCEVPDFELFTYSFPCQDISTAGKQRGFSEGSGTRSSCLWACADAIRIKRPKFLLMENVKALTQKKFRGDFERWRKTLEEMGYTNYWQVLNAKHYGVPQNRERVFMVSFLNDCQLFQFPAPIPLECRLKDILEVEVDERYYLKSKQIRSIIEHCRRKVSEGCGFKTNFQTGNGISGAIKTKEGSREYDTYIIEPIGYTRDRSGKEISYHPIDVANTIHTSTGGGGNTDQFIIEKIIEPIGIADDGCAFALTTRSGNVGASNLMGGGHYPMTGVIEVGALNPHEDGSCRTLKAQYSKNGVQNFARTDSFGATGVIAVGDISHSRLRKMFEDGKIDPDKILFLDAYNQSAVEDVAGTLTTRVDRSNHTWVSIPAGQLDEPFYIKFVRVRKLTPRECFRLMGVPEEYIDRLLLSGLSNSQLYKAAGNSIVVDVLYHIFRQMFTSFVDKPKMDTNGQYLLF